MKYVLKVSYDGTHFSGWQIQKNARTVQGVLEETAAAVFRERTKITGGGRTDAGVHALAQICELEGKTSIPAHKLRECFNRFLPSDVSVLESAAAPDGFDCTRTPRRKTYLYRAYFSRFPVPLYERYETRLKKKPSAERMKTAAALLEGEHDFKAFSSVGSSVKTSVRRIDKIEITERADGIGVFHYEIRVAGNGFLYNMVRIISGELFEIGFGKDCSAIEKALSTGKRCLLAGTMPAKGLFLENTEYEVPLFCGSGGCNGIF